MGQRQHRLTTARRTSLADAPRSRVIIAGESSESATKARVADLPRKRTRSCSCRQPRWIVANDGALVRSLQFTGLTGSGDAGWVGSGGSFRRPGQRREAWELETFGTGALAGIGDMGLTLATSVPDVAQTVRCDSGAAASSSPRFPSRSRGRLHGPTWKPPRTP